MEELKNLIQDYDARRRYAASKAEEAFENKDEFMGKVYEIIEVAYSDLLYKLNNIK